MTRRLTQYPFENKSGIVLKGNVVETIKQENFKVLDVSAGGDAPKDVIRMYCYDGIIRKQSLRTWPTYIVKIGHKWYPNESVTEQLITEIGKMIRVKIAESRLANIEGIVRFCSKHFHSKKQVLNHGAEILSRYIDESDSKWVDELDQKKQIKAFVNVEDVITAIRNVFDDNEDRLIENFVSMLLFDCFVGNNDRHYYNWGVVTHLEGKHAPYFAPIYDSARALWWNSADKFIISLHNDPAKEKSNVKKYIERSMPKISIPKNENCNHFELVEHLNEKGYITPKNFNIYADKDILSNICEMIDRKFRNLMIVERRELIKETLTLRWKRMNEILFLK